MSKTTKITKANSVFLATVLVAGIIALSYPSFMIGARSRSNKNSMEMDKKVQ